MEHGGAMLSSEREADASRRGRVGSELQLSRTGPVSGVPSIPLASLGSARMGPSPIVRTVFYVEARGVPPGGERQAKFEDASALATKLRGPWAIMHQLRRPRREQRAVRTRARLKARAHGAVSADQHVLYFPPNTLRTHTPTSATWKTQ